MTDQVRDADATTTPTETPTGRMNPYSLAMGWVGGILLGIGVIVMLWAAGHANEQPDGIVNLPTLLTGSAVAAFGLLAIMLLLAAQLIRWSPPAEPVAESD